MRPDTKELVERLHILWPKFETEEVQIPGWIIELCEEAADAIERLERVLEEAERAIKPFAEVARTISDEAGVPEYAISDNRLVPMTLGECRAARKWMESRHD